jgi:hypothetical protein
VQTGIVQVWGSPFFVLTSYRHPSISSVHTYIHLVHNCRRQLQTPNSTLFRRLTLPEDLFSAGNHQFSPRPRSTPSSKSCNQSGILPVPFQLPSDQCRQGKFAKPLSYLQPVFTRRLQSLYNLALPPNHLPFFVFLSITLHHFHCMFLTRIFIKYMGIYPQP